MDMESRFLQYQKNVYSSMVEQLAGDLGVSVDSINKLGIGFCPGRQSWVWAERDDRGQIVGLLHRYPNGKKRMEEGSKRGLIYELFSTLETDKWSGTSKRSNFIRAYNAGIDCPLCGKRDWCLVSNDSPQAPSAIICGRTSEGAEKYIEGAGYLHIKGGKRFYNTTTLSASSKHYLIVEGPTDVLAAMDMGYVAVGKPSAEGRSNWLASLLKGQNVIVVGENDDAGRHGMQKTFQALKAATASVQKVLPPSQHKDLRAWHPTAAEFEVWINEKADKADPDRMIPLAVAQHDMMMAEKWLAEHFQGEQRLLHCIYHDFYSFANSHYNLADREEIDGLIYNYFRNYEIIGGKSITPLRVDERFVRGIKKALAAICYIKVPDGVYEPFYIDSKEQLDTSQVVMFRNGLYHVDTGKLEPPSPKIFVTSTLPFDYNPKADYLWWLATVKDIFNEDDECHDLLQEWFGYNLTSSTKFQQMMFFFGVPGSGKSTILSILQAMLGPQRNSTINIDDFGSRFGLAPLVGKYAALVTEEKTKNNREGDKVLAKLKQITGEDTVNIDRKFKDPVSIKLFSRITYAGNEPLSFRDEPGALVRRLNLLYFRNNYYELGTANPNLSQKLMKEIPGVAIWALQGLKRLLEQGRFTVPEASREHLTDMQKLTNPLRAMLDENCIFVSPANLDKDTDYTPTFDLFDLHKAVYEENDIRPMSPTMFGIKLKSLLPRHVKKCRRRVAGELINVYEGLRIKPSAHRRYLGRPT